MGRQKWWWGRSLTAVAVAGLAVTGCSASGDGAAGPVSGSTPSSSGSPGAGGGPADEHTTLPGLPTARRAESELSGLKVAPHGSMNGYSRAKFPHWAQQGDDCDTREVILRRDGTDVKRDSQCRAVSGHWVSAYDDKVFTDSSDLDIDHMVPLANAWRSGAASWTQERRKAFANDLTHPQLLAVSAASNRSKGDQGPDEWQPPAKAYWCTYARAWVSVKSTYELTVTRAEKNELGEMLGTCEAS
ncbi:HNH endonuclease family protein [Streptomyces beihaiensis]|uniref:HNH endonuclease family protein n=1 Tax=Streptomyces beihaiensis TaxID=2984495 RepID=A0ABT3U1S3_9ACTN|nr:HNH endonuclease family protein [Streptomyces beihaiensis]MCX3062656.1 HNH endonuclease family protein [Streptomyces beihaiensis]